MSNIAHIYQGNKASVEDIVIFNNRFEDNIWNFHDYHKIKSTPYLSINFNIEYNGYSLLKETRLLNEIKGIIYNRFKAGIKIRSNIEYFQNIKSFIIFMFSHDITNFSRINNVHLDIYKNATDNRFKLNVLRVSFDYKTGSSDSFQFKPYINQNISKGYKKHSQTRIFEENEWKDICVFSENKVDGFFNDIEKNKEILNFIRNNKTMEQRKICYHFKKKFNVSLEEWRSYLSKIQTYCALLIQAYTGMRLSELLSLQRGCLQEEIVSYNNTKITLYKIKGLTFKYRNSNGDLKEEGVQTYWFCPAFLNKVFKCLDILTYNHHEHFNIADYFISLNYSKSLKYRVEINSYYNKLLHEEGVITDDINSHMFRRTLARFFAKSVLDIPVEALKEQYKHFDKTITQYYMRDTETADNSFIELMESYSEDIINGNRKSSEKLKLFVKRNIKQAITTAKNIEELSFILDNKTIEIVNDYMITTDTRHKSLSPIECLTCNGVIILPDLHIQYWKEMLIMYDELLMHEPNSIWYNRERKMILDVVEKLINNEAYIAKGKQNEN